MHWKLDVVADREALGKQAADIMIAQLQADPTTVFALPTGRTPLPVYQRLVAANQAGGVSFSQAHIFQLDEFYPIEADCAGSFRRFLERELVEHVDVDPTRLHFFNGMAEHPEAECDRIEAEIATLGGLDMALLGIGENGHIAFNEPGTPFDARTHLAELDDHTREAASYLFDSAEEVPRRALTMGLATVMDAKRMVLLAAGSRKAEVIREALEGPLSPAMPASVLRDHPALLILLDREAAALLSPETIQTGSL